MADSFTWKNHSGSWTTASNWADITTSTDPATAPPAAGDLVTLRGPTSHTTDLVTGPGAAGTLTLLGNVALAQGGFVADTLLVGTTIPATLDLLTATLGVSAATLAGTELVVNGAGATFAADGSVSLSGTVSNGTTTGALYALGHGFVQLGGVSLQDALLGVAATGTVEIGSAGAAAAGKLTVDAGATLAAGGVSQITADAVDDGLIDVTGTLELAGLEGSGTLRIEAGAYALLDDAVGAGTTIAFAAASGSLALPGSFAVDALVSGFQPGATLFAGGGVTAAGFSGGTLSLNGLAGTIGTLTLAEDDGANAFLVLPLATGFDPILSDGYESAVVMATNAVQAPAAAPAGTDTGHSFTWLATAGGAWADTANWQDVTDDAAATVAPGTNDAVAIQSTPDAPFQIVNGDGNAQSLTLVGDFGLAGHFAAGSLVLGTAGVSPSLAMVELTGSAVLTTGSASVEGALVVDGSLDAGFVTLGPQSTASGTLEAVGGGQVRLDYLTLGGLLSTVAVDAGSAIEIGSAGGAVLGALNIDAGTGLSGSGNIEADVVLNGTIYNGIYTLQTINGDIDGSGMVRFDYGSDVKLDGTVGAGITIDMANINDTLDLTDAGAMAGVITDFDRTDRIRVPEAASDTQFDSASGTVRLRDPSGTDLGTLSLQGSFTGDSILALPNIVPGFGTRIVEAAGTLASGTLETPSAGSGAADSYVWTGLGGDWGGAANWATLSGYTQVPASVAPGVTDAVTIDYPAASSSIFQVVSGAGEAASLSTNGNLVLSGSFDVGALTLGFYAYDIGSIDVVAGATLVATDGLVNGGALAVQGAGATASFAGTLAVAAPLGVQGIPGIAVVDHSSLFAAALSVSGYYANLIVDSSSLLEIGTAGTASAGALVIDPGATLASTASDFLYVQGAVVNNGSFIAGQLSGVGSVDISGALSGTGTIGFGGTLSLDGDVAASQTLQFFGGGVLQLYATSELAPILGFNAGEAILDESGIYDTATYAATGADTGTLTLSEDGVAGRVLSLAGRDYTGQTFVVNPAAGGTMVELAAPSAVVPCFATGTRIATVRGEVAVESLRLGDIVVNPWGEHLDVRWIGHRRIDCRRHPRPHDVRPVRIRAHAFAPGQPHRDLVLGPDHAVFCDGVLIPVRYLVNGATIVAQPAGMVTYWHVELFRHDVLLAEGLPTESYLDTGNRHAFADAGAALALHPDFARDPWDAWNTLACARLVLDGPALAAQRRLLLRRARELGHVPTRDPGLLVQAGGRTLAPIDAGDGCVTVELPPATGPVRLVSRSIVPAHLREADADHRRLGIAIASLRLDDEAVGLDDARLQGGWHPAEPGWRWTDGAATLDCRGATRLTLGMLGMLEYWSAAGLRAG